MNSFRQCLAQFGLGLIGLGLFSGNALAAQPKPWQLGFQDAATDNMTQITNFNDFLLILMTAITLVVLGLMVYVMLRFNAKANPEPSKTTHNTLVEVVWTVVPILILVIIAIPSFRLLYYQRVLPEADMTVKATGYQWYWGYEYPDHGGFAFDSLMLNDDERGDQPRLLATDTAMVVPVNTTVARHRDRRRCAAQLGHACFWRQDGRSARSLERNMVPRRTNRHLLRSMLGALRHSSRLHADPR